MRWSSRIPSRADESAEISRRSRTGQFRQPGDASPRTKEIDVTARRAKTGAVEDTSAREFVITRKFDAPRALVWKAFTEPERMKHWWGPKGFTVIAANMDLRPGGTYH